ncbi:sensor histidine kinase [Runella limosa]|uniref:sensor histidine kinase n=1 Tax=Runella limosa TaxID=370978 RepID=UPI00041B9DDE|nr:HAMP domain-containing sensor histidine kinase [Runella limosa]
MSKGTKNTLSSGSYATRTGGLLMVASMLLLAAFLVFWLRKEYQEQKSILQKETDILFRTTIQTMEDSVIQQKISAPLDTIKNPSIKTAIKKKPNLKKTVRHAALAKDFTPPIPTYTIVQSNKTFKDTSASVHRFMSRLNAPQLKDSSIFTKDRFYEVLMNTKPKDIRAIRVNQVGNITITTMTIQDSSATGKSDIMFVRSLPKTDTLQDMVGKVARAFIRLNIPNDSTRQPAKFKQIGNIKISIRKTDDESKKQEVGMTTTKSNAALEKQFVIRLDQDSLQLNDIQKVYGRQIKQARLQLPFKVIRKKTTDTTAKADSLRALATSAVKTALPMGSTYRAIFADYQGYLLKKIIPQSLFSFLLLAITGLAFGAIYRNFQQQRRLTELKNDFISNMTHELKTPIATVSVAIEALQNFGAAQNPKLTQEYLEISKNELSRLTLLVDKVLKMATFEQQGLQLNQEELDAAQLVEQVLQSMKIQFEKFRANVQFTTQGSDFLLTADRVHLTNVIYNLLDNALKYSESTPEIALQLSETPTQLTLIVSDQGIGIPAEYQTRVFDKFFRVPTGDTHNVKGYGLGLNYVASVVQQHHGTITVESEAGKGSTFTITLPKA